MADDQLPKPPISEDAIADSKGVVVAESPSSQECKKDPVFSEDEETLIIRMYNLVGVRWSLIAGRIPGRSAEEIERYWNSRQSTSDQQKPENLDLFPKK